MYLKKKNTWWSYACLLNLPLPANQNRLIHDATKKNIILMIILELLLKIYIKYTVFLFYY